MLSQLFVYLQQVQWERELLQRTVDYSNCQIDPSPFQLVERTSLLKVHTFVTSTFNFSKKNSDQVESTYMCLEPKLAPLDNFQFGELHVL